jgi:hypothetical protein
MKKILFTFLSVVILGSVNAQENGIQTLFGGDTRISGMGGPMMGFSSIDGEFAHMMGGGGGVLLGDLFLGGYGMGLTNSIMAGGNKTEFGHGGFWVGYSLMGKKPFHPVVSTQMGWGTITQVDDNIELYPPDGIFVMNPAVELEMNFTRFFRLGIGAHYRLVSGVNTSVLANRDFSGPGAFMTFRFGWF